MPRPLGRVSGGLHRAERSLCGVGTPEYDAVLRRAFREAEAVLVVNPLAEAMLSPARPGRAGGHRGHGSGPVPLARARRIGGDAGGPPVAAALRRPGRGADEGLRGAAPGLRRLWGRRRDFELLATADPPGPVDTFTRHIGWQSQEELPRRLRAADVLVMPTIAQEALGRTAVEADGRGPAGGRQPDRRAAVHRAATAPPACSASRATPRSWPGRWSGCWTTRGCVSGWAAAGGAGSRSGTPGR